MKPLTSFTLAAVLLALVATLTYAGTAGNSTAQTQATASYVQLSFLHLKFRFKPFEFSR